MIDKISVVSELKKLTFYPLEVKKEYINSLNLTINDCHDLYKLWYNVDKSCLQGNKSGIINSLLNTLNSSNTHSIIMFHGTTWNKMSPEQKSCYDNCRVKNDNLDDSNIYIEYAKSENLLDDNFEKFIKYIKK